MPESRNTLRKKFRQARQSLSVKQQQQAALDLSNRLKIHPAFIRSKHIAFYIADDGEIDPIELMMIAQTMGKHTYLPVLQPLRQKIMWFAPVKRNEPLHCNYFGIPEPLPGKKKRPPFSLDLVIMPLVAFDNEGNRLGMGGGFYDRAFAFRQRCAGRPGTAKPTLIGVAHQCQQADKLNSASWDIPLDFIATDKKIIKCR
ncbi:MAG: 5-formyltetrahydrofolate cyclo-ligase [Pseudomonadales bacterium]|nr:5-formyltetrahydrofolate cyclo-ligase [Pseudomonadales bacterium]